MTTKTAPPRASLQRKGAVSEAAVAPRKSMQVSPEGIVRAIVAVTGVVDNVNDLILPGAFTASLKKRTPKVVDDHEWQRRAGRVLHVEEWLPGDERLPKRTKDGNAWPAEAGALVATMQYNLRTIAGRESYEWVRFYAETNEAEFSIGYRVPEGMALLRRDKVRIIRAVDLFEFSHVLFGAASQTMALEVKGVHGGTAGALDRPALGDAERVGEDEDDETPPPPIDTRKPWESETKKAPMEIKSAAALVAAAQVPMETKGMNTMKGSYEERTSLLSEAARELLSAQGDDGECNWVDVIATYEAEVIVCAYHEGCSKPYLIPYTFDAEEGAVELGAPEPVELSLTAQPKGDADYEGDPEPAEAEVEDVAVLEPTLAGLVRASMIANLKGKAGDTVRARILAIADGLQTKSAEPVPADEDGPDAPAVPVDDDPALAPVADEGDEEPTHEADPAEEASAADYSADNLPEGEWGVFRKTEPIEALRMEGPFSVETREGVVECEDGWLALDSEGYPYPIAADEFEAVYEPSSDAAPTPDNVDGIDPDAPAGNGPAPGDEAPVDAPADDAESDAEGDAETVTLSPDEHFATVDSLKEAGEKADAKLAQMGDDEDENPAAA